MGTASSAAPFPEAISRYLKLMETVPGWFKPLDARLFVAIDSMQKIRGISGDLLEIGSYLGKSAIVLGHLKSPEERLVVCDVFGEARALSGENLDESLVHYENLTRHEFERQYLRFHRSLPAIWAMPSTEIDRDAFAGSFRFVHVDGSHAYEVVREDVATARSLLGSGGVVVFDDWTESHAPGVGLALWEEYLRGEIIPLCTTHNKFYATWDGDGLTSADFDAWAEAQPDIELSHAHRLGDRDVRLYVTAPPPRHAAARRASRIIYLGAPPIALAACRRIRRRVRAVADRPRR